MNCPACTNPLTTFSVEGVEVDACVGGCGGVWFDNFELPKFDEAHELVDEALLSVPFDPLVHVDLEAKRNCPKCGVSMMRHFFSARRRTRVDECPQCGGNWLDVGELSQVRAELQKSAGEAPTVKSVLNKRLRWFVATS